MFFGCVWAYVGHPPAIYVEPHQCPSHHAILLTQWRICEIFIKIFWELAILKNGHFWKMAILDFFSKEIIFFFCFILMKISPNLYGRMDGLKFWCFLWFPENSLLCVILLQCSVPKGDLHCQCILSIFPASVHQFYVNILVFININPFIYVNNQFALSNITKEIFLF